VKVQAQGATLHVELRGPETHTKPPVLLLHGYPLSHAMWAPQLAALSGRHRFVAPDFRGHGQSEAGDGQYTMELLVDDVLAVLDALDLEQVIGCGLSMGGYVLLRALERFPERFRAVVLADTRSDADDDTAKLARAAAVRTLKTEGVGPFAQGITGRLLGPTTLERRPELRGLLRGLIQRNPVLGLCGAQLAMAGRTDTTRALRALRVPALIVVGEEDGLTPPALAQKMADEARGARLEVLPGAGHLSNMENPAAFTAVLEDFLRGVGNEA